jgi:hypothetical protein
LRLALKDILQSRLLSVDLHSKPRIGFATLTLSEVIDKCQKAGVNLKSSVDYLATTLPFKPLPKLKRKYVLRGYGPAMKRAHFERNQE